MSEIEACAACKVPFTDGYYMKDDQKYCEPCIIDLETPKCLHCKKNITGEYLSAFECSYHKECFLCSACNAQITSRCYLVCGAMVCADCNNKMDLWCLMCRQRGGKPMVTVGKFNAPFHRDCFKCNDCGVLIAPDGKFVCKGNILYLPDCYQKYINKALA